MSCPNCEHNNTNCCDVCNCLNVFSSDDSVSITKSNCDIDLKIDSSTIDGLFTLNNGTCISFIKEIIAGKLVLTPIINWTCVAAHVCGLCTPPPDPNPNLIFTWSRTSGDAMNLGQVTSPYIRGIDGSFSQIDWGDGTINTSLTHTYSTTGSFTVTITDSTATTVGLRAFNLTALTKIPTTTQLLDCSYNSITIYPVLTSTALYEVDFNTNNISNVPDFTGTPNLSYIVFDNNNITGAVTLVGSAHGTIAMASNHITSINIAGKTNLTYLQLGANNFTSMPSLTGCTHIDHIIIDGNPITGTVDLSAVTTLTNVSISQCLITQVTGIGSNPLLHILDASQNHITSATNINNILTAIDGLATFAGELSLQSQSTPTAPTGAGATAKTALIGRGWSVTTD